MCVSLILLLFLIVTIRFIGLFYGDFIKIREERDYTFHDNYTESRQLWQDMAVKTCLGRTEAQARPWVVYTCGPMGVGKGHVYLFSFFYFVLLFYFGLIHLFLFQVLSWLSKQGLFPLEYIVHVDPDFFKSIMPEVFTHALLFLYFI